MAWQIQLLQLPSEIILRILDHLFINQEIMVERAIPEGPGATPVFRMKNVTMGAQLIRTCRQMHRETHTLLYGQNTFNCSQREGLKLLLQSIGFKNFSAIKHIIIDWEQIQDFAWSLAKEDYNSAMAGLEIVELATWRTRMLGGTSFILREAKSYERQLCQAAFDICEKHPRLKVVAQRPFHRSVRVGTSSHRVKWRFVMSAKDMWSNEVAAPIAEELAQLKASSDTEAGGAGASQMIDPF